MRFGGVLLVLASGAAMLSAQSAGAPEIRLGARDYALPPLTLTAQTNSVETTVVVRGRDGQPMAGLTREQFQILDGGHPRAISAFSVITGPPPPRIGRGGWAATPNTASATAVVPASPAAGAPVRLVALFFDDVNTDIGDLGNARIAALRFVREALQPDDRVAVFTASSEQTQDFTSDRDQLIAAIGAIRTHARQSDSIQPCPRITPYRAYLIVAAQDPMAIQAAYQEWEKCPQSPALAVAVRRSTPRNPLPLPLTALPDDLRGQIQVTWSMAQTVYDDTLHAVRSAVDVLAAQPGQRVLLVASGGFLNGGSMLGEAQEHVIQDALHAGIVISGLDAKGLYAEAPGRPLREQSDVGVLPIATYIFEETSRMDMHQAQMASVAAMAASTGGLMFENSNDLFLGFYQLGLAPSISYSLAFAPHALPRDGKYHRLKVVLADVQHDALEYRPGYFDPVPEAATANIDERIAATMRDTAVHAGGPGDLDAKLEAVPEANGTRVEVGVDARKLPFTNQGGRRQERLIIVAGLFDGNGQFINGKWGEMDLALRADTLQRLETQGLATNLNLPAKPGTYRLRIVALEANRGQLCASNVVLRVP